MRGSVSLAIFLVPAALCAGDKTIPRYIEFRDGSILRLNVIDEDWPVTIIRENGGWTNAKVKISAIASFTLTTEKGFADKLEMLSNVRKLGSEDFWDREKAMAELIKLKSKRNIRGELEACLPLITDLETEARIKRVLEHYPKPAANEPVPINFDLFHYKETCWGHLGDEGIPVLYEGKKLRLKRSDVKRLGVDVPPQLAGLIRPRGVAVGVRRLGTADFPPGCIDEGFERAPDGRNLVVGENIQKLFIPRGFILSTAVANSFVSINSFTVSGKSRGYSVANHQPLWEGEITIKFVLPGREDVPAGVTHFGCYLAAVVPKGTALVAEDIHGRELGRVETQNNGHDFVGIHSPVPMHKIRIVPDTKLDRDYTLDDFIFTPPQSVEAGHPQKYTAYLDTGRAHFRDVIFTKDKVHIIGMSGDLPDLIVPRAAVWRINAPDKVPEKMPTSAEQARIADFLKQLSSKSAGERNTAKEGLDAIGPIALPTLRKTFTAVKVEELKTHLDDVIRRLEARDYFVELRDGSVLAGRVNFGKKRPYFAGLPGLYHQPEQIAGLWHVDSPRFAPAMAKPPVFWKVEEKKWHEIREVRFLDSGFEGKVDGFFKEIPYVGSSVWLTAPRDRVPAGTWLIHTKSGSDLVLDVKVPITGKWSEDLSASWQGKALRLAGTEIRAVSQVGNDSSRLTPKQ